MKKVEHRVKLVDENGHKVPVTLEMYELGTAAYLSSFGDSVKSGVLDKIINRYDVSEHDSNSLKPEGNR